MSISKAGHDSRCENSPEISLPPGLFPRGSLTGENTFFSVTLSPEDFPCAAALVTVVVVEPLRTLGRAGDPVVTVPVLLRVRDGDRVTLAAEGRRAGFVIAVVGSACVAGLTVADATGLAFGSDAALTFFYKIKNVNIVP